MCKITGSGSGMALSETLLATDDALARQSVCGHQGNQKVLQDAPAPANISRCSWLEGRVIQTSVFAAAGR